MEKGFEFLTTRRVWWECDVHIQDTNSSAIGPEEYSVRGGSLVLYNIPAEDQIEFLRCTCPSWKADDSYGCVSHDLDSSAG